MKIFHKLLHPTFHPHTTPPSCTQIKVIFSAETSLEDLFIREKAEISEEDKLSMNVSVVKCDCVCVLVRVSCDLI